MDEVVQDTNLDQEVPHITFGQRDQSLENHEIGEVDMVPLDGTGEQQLIDDIVNLVDPYDSGESVEQLINELDHMQDKIDVELEQIRSIGSGNAQERPRRSIQTTRGQRQNPRYDEEYKLCVAHSDQNRNISPMSKLDITEHIIGVVFTQYSFRAGLTKFKKQGEEAIQQELKQPHDMDVFVPVPAENLSPEQKKKALSTVTFIKEK